MAVSFDLFGTLVVADRPSEPAAAISAELAAEGIQTPADWSTVYRHRHTSVPDGRQLPLSDHVQAALHSRDIDAPIESIRTAVCRAFDRPVETVPGATQALAIAAECGPVGLYSNCSVPDLVPTVLSRSTIDPAVFDVIHSSVDTEWRKPAPEAFERLAADLDVGVEQLVHVGDSPQADGGIESLGGTALLIETEALSTVLDELSALACQ